jgi:hypothetical protein
LQISDASQTVQSLVREDISRSSRGIAMYHQPAANQDLGEWGRNGNDQIQGAGHSGHEQR